MHMPDGSTGGDDWIADLELELSNRSRLVDLLDAAVGRQESLIRDEDTAGLLELLGMRQQVVDEIEAGSDRLVELLDRFEDEAGRLAGQRVTAVRELVRRIGRRLDLVLEADARSCELVSGHLERLRGELTETAQASRAAHAYHPAGAVDARFSDRRA